MLTPPIRQEKISFLICVYYTGFKRIVNGNKKGDRSLLNLVGRTGFEPVTYEL
jgi:hypothetical protein